MTTTMIERIPDAELEARAATAAFAVFVPFEVSFLPPKQKYLFEKMREDVAPSLSL